MKKLLILFGAFLLSLTLVACDGDTIEVTDPSFLGFKVNDQDAVSGSDFVTFYEGKSDTVELTVLINNPSNLLITKIVVNGDNYRINKFKEGSTLTNIVFDVNVGTDTGEVIFSIDEIDYEHDDTTRTVNIDQNNEFRVYVFKDEPTVVRDKHQVDKESISVDLLVTDIDGVIDPDSFIVELFKGTELVYSKQIPVESQKVIFSNDNQDGYHVLSNTPYTVKVKGSYDLDYPGGSFTDKDLFAREFVTLTKTAPVASILNVSATGDEVAVDVSFTDLDNVLINDEIIIRLTSENDPQVHEISVTESGVHTVPDLFNGTDYTVEIVGIFDLNDSEGNNQVTRVLASDSITTTASLRPITTINGMVIEENRVMFKVDINDVHEVLRSDITATITIGDLTKTTTISEDGVADFQIFNVFSNYVFTIEISATVNLGDADGEQNIVLLEKDYLTQENVVPVVSVSDVIVQQGYITLLLNVFDANQTLQGELTATLYNDLDEVVDTIVFDASTEEIIFEHMIQNTVSYYITIHASYNLRDGNGTQPDILMFDYYIVSAEKKAPVVEIESSTIGKTSATLIVSLLDADGTVENGALDLKLKLPSREETPDSVTLINTDNGKYTYEFIFSNLYSGTEYQVVGRVNYDLDDGGNLQSNQVIHRSIMETLEKAEPVVTISNKISTFDSVTFDILVDDFDEVIDDPTLIVRLMKNGMVIDETDPHQVMRGFNSVTFNSNLILANNDYSIVVLSKLNYNKETPDTAVYVIGEDLISTKEKAIPTAEITILDQTSHSITLDVNITDPNNVIEDGTRYVRLYINNVPVYEQMLLNNLSTNVVLDDPAIKSNSRIVVKVEVDYDLGENEVPTIVENAELAISFVDTLQNDLPELDLANIVPDIDNVTFDVVLTDDDNVVLNDVVTITIKDSSDQDVIGPLDYDLDSLSNITFNPAPLTFGTEYTIEAKITYNLNTTNSLDTVIIASTTFTTKDIVSITGLEHNRLVDTISRPFVRFDVELKDDTGILANTDLEAAVYMEYNGNSTLVLSNLAIDGTEVTTLELYNLWYDTTYKVVVKGDKGSGLDDIFTYYFETESILLPTFDISDLDFDSDVLTFDINEVSDDELVLSSGNYNIELFDADGNLIGTNTIPLGDSSYTFDFSADPTVDLMDGSNYTLIISAQINMQDGFGEVTYEFLRESFASQGDTLKQN